MFNFILYLNKNLNEKFTKLYDESLNKPLDYEDSKELLRLRGKHNFKVDIDRKQLTPISRNRKSKVWLDEEYLLSKYNLTAEEEKELNDLLFKRLFNENKLNVKDAERLEFLYNKKGLDVYLTLSKDEGGLCWEEYKDFRRIFNKLKTKLNLKDDLLEIPLSNYNKNIRFNDKVHYNRFSKKRKDGMLPDGELIEDWFTVNAKDLTPREKEVADRWLGPDYRLFADFFDSEKDVKKFAKKLEHKYDELLEVNKKAIAKGEDAPIKQFTLDIYKIYKDPGESLKEAKSIAHDLDYFRKYIAKSNQKRNGDFPCSRRTFPWS